MHKMWFYFRSHSIIWFKSTDSFSFNSPGSVFVIKRHEGIFLHPVLKARTSNPQILNSTEAERFLLKGNDTLRSSETVNQLQENVNVLSRSDELLSALRLSCKYINPARHSCQLLLIALSTPSTSTGHLQLCFCFT